MSARVISVGAVCFGIVIGYITYRTLARSEKASVSDIAAVVAAVGGGTVTTLFDRNGSDSFGGTRWGCSLVWPCTLASRWPSVVGKKPPW